MAQSPSAITPFKADPADELPLGVQLDWRLRALIRSGRLAPGERMPSVRALAEWASVNVNTVRGVYARRDLPAGHVITDNDVYLSVPLLQGQISCRELMRGEVLLKPVQMDASIDITDIDSPYAHNEGLQSLIRARGLPR